MMLQAGFLLFRPQTKKGQTMGETITINVQLKAFVRKEKRDRWIAICPRIGVASQGRDRGDAMRCLHEAVELWFESCIERGLLDQAMRESNFRPLGTDEPIAPDAEHITVARLQAEADDLLGDAFSVELAIPAYQAAMFGSAPA